MTINPLRWSWRARCVAGFAACAALIGFAIFSQFQWGLQPCPLCIFQRIAFAATGAVLLLAGLHAPRATGARRLYAFLALVPAATGLAVAGRHVWLTHLPADQVPSCGPPLSFMMEANAVTDVIRKVLTGSGECAKVDWTFLGLSMPAWSALWFVLLVVLALSLFARAGGRGASSSLRSMR